MGNEKRLTLGYYATAEQAAAAFDWAAYHHHGEFAKTNGDVFVL